MRKRLYFGILNIFIVLGSLLLLNTKEISAEIQEVDVTVISLQANKTYSFYNYREQGCTIQNIDKGAYFDSINSYSYDIEMRYKKNYNENIDVMSRSQLEIKVVSGNVKLAIPNDLLSTMKIMDSGTEPILKEVFIESNVNYQIVNNDKYLTNYIKIPCKGFEVISAICKDDNGNFVDIQDSYFRSFYIKPGYSIEFIIQNSENSYSIIYPSKFGECIKKIDNPVKSEFIINPGETLVFENKGDKKKGLTLSRNYGNWDSASILWSTDNLPSLQQNISITSYMLNPGEVLELTTVEGDMYPLKGYISYEDKEYVKIEKRPLYYEKPLVKGYYYTLSDNAEYCIVIPKYYNLEVLTLISDINYKTTTLNYNCFSQVYLNKKYKHKITTMVDSSNGLIVPYKFNDSIKLEQGEFYSDIKVKPSETIKLTNPSSFKVSIKPFYNGGEFSAKNYDKYGNFRGNSYHRSEDIILNPGYSIELTAYGSNVGDVRVLIPTIINTDDKDLDALDLNRDGEVDIYDLSLLAVRNGATSTETAFSTAYDFNKDMVIDIADIVIIAKKL